MTGYLLPASRIGPSVRNALAGSPHAGCVVSAFTGGVGLLIDASASARPALISLQGPTAPFHPWAIEMPDTPVLAVGTTLQATGERIRFGTGLEIDWADACASELRIRPLSPSLRRLGADRLATRAPEGLSADLEERLVSWRSRDDLAALTDLVGRGPGSSPLGDDLLVGILAGLAAEGTQAATFRAVSRTLGGVSLVDRTPLGSAQLLADAVNGQFPEPLCRLLGCLAAAQSEDMLDGEIERLLRLGASSGRGFLRGLRAGLEASLPSS